VKPGVVNVIDAFKRETARAVKVAFATAPEISRRINANEADLIIAPPRVIDEWVKAGKAAQNDRITIGSVGIGVVVRAGAAFPRIATVDDFRQSALRAESLVYNQASTGLYLEDLFARLGIAQDLEAKITRYPDAASVLSHVANGSRNEMGLAATTVIVEAASRGLEFAGPLPGSIQNYTAYEATLVRNHAASEQARELLRYLGSPRAKEMFKTAGIE
jgi:molybdate transport system substrate-binding protein